MTTEHCWHDIHDEERPFQVCCHCGITRKIKVMQQPTPPLGHGQFHPPFYLPETVYYKDDEQLHEMPPCIEHEEAKP